jgi:hypothetical protein
MPWTGGVFNRANGPTGWQDDAAASIGIEADRHDTQDNDFRNGINNTLTKDGTNTPTANLNFGGFKITSLGNGTASGDAINYTQITNGAPLGVDYVNSRVGIGTAAPTYIADVSRNANDADSRVRISNTSNGAAAQSGFQIANDTGTGSLLMNSSGNSTGGGANSLNIVQSGNAPVHVWTNGTIKQTILGANGFVGFNETSPGVLVDVVRSANDTLTAVRTRNANTGSSAYSSYILGNNTNASGASVRLNSSANTSLGGANSLNIVNGLNAPLTLSTNGTVRFVVQADGDVEVADKLFINTSVELASNTSLSIASSGSTSASYAIYIQNNSADQLFFIRSDGPVFTGTAALSPYNNTTSGGRVARLLSSGELRGDSSSLRYKRDIRDYTKGLNEACLLRPVFYKTFTDGDAEYAGFIAEEVSAVGLSEFVVYDNDEPSGLNYGNMTALLTAAVKELATKVEALEARLAALEA